MGSDRKPEHLKERPALHELTPKELAERWRMTPGTLANWRSNGNGPPFQKRRNGRVRYLVDVILEWEERINGNT